MITQKQAEVVQLAVEDEFKEYNVGSCVRRAKNGNWYAVLYLQKELPNVTFPTERDGVKIETDVVGVIKLQ